MAIFVNQGESLAAVDWERAQTRAERLVLDAVRAGLVYYCGQGICPRHGHKDGRLPEGVFNSDCLWCLYARNSNRELSQRLLGRAGA